MLIPLSWRALYLGTSALTFTTPAGVKLELRLMDGGGYVASVAVWRVGRQVAHVLEAGDC